MCMCKQPNVNGMPGHSMTGEPEHIRQPHYPPLEEDDKLLWDLPGRCGGVDSHSHDFRIVKDGGAIYLLVRHGGGTERIRLACYSGRDPAAGIHNRHAHASPGGGVAALENASEDARYWISLMIYRAHSDGARDAGESEQNRWRAAAAEGRIKTRKQRNGDRVKVEIISRSHPQYETKLAKAAIARRAEVGTEEP